MNTLTSFILATTVVVALAAPATAQRIATYSSASIGDLETTPGSEGATSILLGFAKPGDGGGGTFYWEAEPATPANEGTVVTADGGGAWVRLFDPPVHAAWFGVFPAATGATADRQTAAQTTRRLQRALDAAAGGTLRLGSGVFFVSDTLIVPANTRLEGAGPQDVSTWGAGGTTLRTFGPGRALKWQDSGTPEKDDLRPLLVFGGSNVRLRNIGLQTRLDPATDSPCWDAGALLPAVKRCTLEHVSIHGHWQVAGCLLDATWSERNKRMIELHDGRITPSSMNECAIIRCFLSGKWGLMIRGVDIDKRDPRDFRDYENKGTPDREPEWLWSYGGTSDIEVISCRIEGKAPRRLQALDGGAFYSDAPLVNGARAGQGHRFFGCNFRTNTRYMIKLGSSNRDSFASCYFEGGYAAPPGDKNSVEVPSELANDPGRTGRTSFIDCRFTTVDIDKHWSYANTLSWPPRVAGTPRPGKK